MTWLKLPLMCLPMLLCGLAEAQTSSTVFPNGMEPPVFFRDTFDDVQWPAEKYNGTFFIEITAGKLFLESDQTVARTERAFFLDEKSDFSISLSLVQVKGEGFTGFILSWGKGKAGSNSYNALTITPAPEPKFKIYSPGQGDDQGKWRPAKLKSGVENPNVVKIEQRDRRLIFFINDEKVYEVAAVPWVGNTIGFGCFGKTVYMVDDFMIRGYRSPEFEDHKEFLPQNLGSAVNSKFMEIYPHVSLDGKEIYYNRQLNDDNLNGNDDVADVWITSLSGNGEWSERRNAGAPINTPKPDLLVSVSSDRNTLLFVDNTGFNIRRRVKTASGGTSWSDLESLGIKFENEDARIEGCLSPNGKALLFGAKLKQNLFYNPNRYHFDTDIYVCIRGKEGWSEPINLGPAINSKEQEAGPVLAADGRTMYFSKPGSSGSYDLFMSRRMGEGWTEWSEPVELGPYINCFGGDTYFSIPACGDYAYFSSIREGYGDADLFKVKLRDAHKPDPVVLVKGIVRNAITKEPLQAGFLITDLAKGEEVGEGTANPATGAFMSALPFGYNYGVYASLSGYLPVHENIDLTVRGDCREIPMDLLLMPIRRDMSFVLKNVFFIQSRPDLRPESYPELDGLADFLKANPATVAELSGHTDNVGDRRALKRLSDDRVSAVKAYLISKGIESSRLTGKGYGPDRPLVKNDTEEHRSMNRRVEARIAGR